jgi:hypothetical protein
MGEGRDKFSVMKVPRKYPLVLLVKEGSGEGRVMRTGPKESN